MNLQQHREEARRRRLINRSLAQHRQRHFEDVRRGMVGPAYAVGQIASAPLSASTAVAHDADALDNPAITRLIRIAVFAMLAGLALQFQAPLFDAAASVFANAATR